MARSYEAIQAQIRKLQHEAEAQRNKERNAAIVRIRAEMARFGITADELGSPKSINRRARLAKSAEDESPAVRLLNDAGIDFHRATAAVPTSGKLPPKYRDPQTGATWSGHARPPAWIKDAQDRSVFLIRKDRLPGGTTERPNGGSPKRRRPAKGAADSKVAGRNGGTTAAVTQGARKAQKRAGSR